MNRCRRRGAKFRRREKAMRVIIVFDYGAPPLIRPPYYFPRDNGASRIYTEDGDVFRIQTHF
jgi:hypothetical protein